METQGIGAWQPSPEARRHTERLLILADLLAMHQDKPEDGTVFRMSVWGKYVGVAPPTLEEADYCGMAACALGHAAMFRPFRAEGLRMEWDGNPINFITSKPGQRIHMAMIRYTNPETGERAADSEHAGCLFFGLTRMEGAVFTNTGNGRAEVIARLRALAASRKEITPPKCTQCGQLLPPPAPRA